MRLIDADELRRKAYAFPCAIGVEYAVPRCEIDSAPTIQPEIKEYKDYYHCPFCGNPIEILCKKGATSSGGEPRWAVTCFNCNFLFGYDIDYGGIYATHEEALHAWSNRENRR